MVYTTPASTLNLAGRENDFGGEMFTKVPYNC